MSEKTVVAPPGRLSVYFESVQAPFNTVANHVIAEVRTFSSIEGQVDSGDCISAIDSIPTLEYDAEELVKLLIIRSGQERRILSIKSDVYWRDTKRGGRWVPRLKNEIEI